MVAAAAAAAAAATFAAAAAAILIEIEHLSALSASPPRLFLLLLLLRLQELQFLTEMVYLSILSWLLASNFFEKGRFSDARKAPTFPHLLKTIIIVVVIIK